MYERGGTILEGTKKRCDHTGLALWCEKEGGRCLVWRGGSV